jgi:hypothetical protein
MERDMQILVENNASELSPWRAQFVGRSGVGYGQDAAEAIRDLMDNQED